MPPCQKVLQNKINRTICLTRMIKSCNINQISLPEATGGYRLDDNKKFVIKYFSGLPYPDDIEDLLHENGNDLESDQNSSDDEDHSDDENNDEDSHWF